MSNQGPALPPLIDNPQAPEVFADELVGVFFNSGNIRMTFASGRSDHSRDPAVLTRVVMARLVMPAGSVEGAIQLLSQFLSYLKARAAAAQAPRQPHTVQ